MHFYKLENPLFGVDNHHGISIGMDDILEGLGEFGINYYCNDIDVDLKSLNAFLRDEKFDENHEANVQFDTVDTSDDDGQCRYSVSVEITSIDGDTFRIEIFNNHDGYHPRSSFVMANGRLETVSL